MFQKVCDLKIRVPWVKISVPQHNSHPLSINSWPDRSMLPVVGTWMWCRCWSSLYCATSMQTSLAWRYPGSMWAWFSQPFVGILRITGVTPLTTSTGEWGSGGPGRQGGLPQDHVCDHSLCPLSTWTGVNRRLGMGYPRLQPNIWRRWWRSWHLNSLIASLTSCTNLSPSWIPIP